MTEKSVSIGDILGRNHVAVHANGSFLTTLVPEVYKFYLHTIFDVPGVATPNNFISVFNPVGSGKTVSFFQAEIGSYATGNVQVFSSMTASRISAASAGTAIAPAAVNRFLTSDPNPVAQVRVGNPTVTPVGMPLNSWSPPISQGPLAGATSYTSSPPGEGFACRPGEGLAFSTAAGSVLQAWKINIIWAEF